MKKIRWIRIQDFDDQKLKTKFFFFLFLIKNCNLPVPRPPYKTSKLQERPSALKREHQALKKLNSLFFSISSRGYRYGSTTLTVSYQQCEEGKGLDTVPYQLDKHSKRSHTPHLPPPPRFYCWLSWCRALGSVPGHSVPWPDCRKICTTENRIDLFLLIT